MKKRRKKKKESWEGYVNSTPYGKGTKIGTIVDEYLYSERFLKLSPRSKAMYLSILRQLGTLDLGYANFYNTFAHKIDFTKADYIKFVLGTTLKPASVSLYFSIMSSIWNLAIRNGRLAANPWEKANIKVNNIRDVTWTPEQIKLAISTAKHLGYNLLAAYIAMAYYTAQRPWNDIRDLKWTNLTKDKDNNPILDFVISKTGVRLMLPLNDECITLLNELPRVSEYIFVTEAGNRLTSTTLTQHFKEVRDAASLPTDLMIRDLRRTAVTEMAMSGATAQEITAITGWKVTDSVINRYAVMKLKTAQNALIKREQFRKSNEQSSLPENNAVFKQAVFKA